LTRRPSFCQASSASYSSRNKSLLTWVPIRPHTHDTYNPMSVDSAGSGCGCWCWRRSLQNACRAATSLANPYRAVTNRTGRSTSWSGRVQPASYRLARGLRGRGSSLWHTAHAHSATPTLAARWETSRVPSSQGWATLMTIFSIILSVTLENDSNLGNGFPMVESHYQVLITSNRCVPIKKWISVSAQPHHYQSIQAYLFNWATCFDLN